MAFDLDIRNAHLPKHCVVKHERLWSYGRVNTTGKTRLSFADTRLSISQQLAKDIPATPLPWLTEELFTPSYITLYYH